MMGAVRGWLLAVISVSLLCAVAEALMPPGAVRRVGKLVCGLVLLAAVLSPLRELDLDSGQRWLTDYFSALDRQTSQLNETVDSQMKSIIERKCAAYIVDKAAQLGLTCSARVECRAGEDGLYLPVRADVSGTLPEDGRARLLQIIREDLGIPEDRITIDKEEMP